MAAVSEPTKVIVGRNIRLARAEQGMSQERCASLIGIRRWHLSDYERGVHGPQDDRLDELIATLGHDRSWFRTPHPEEWREWDID